MKILFLNMHDDPAKGGGGEVSVWNLIRGLIAAGHKCVLAVTSDERGLTKSERDGVIIWKAGIRNVYLPDARRSRPLFARALWHLQDSYNPWMQGYVRRIVHIERPDVASLHCLSGWSMAATWATLRSLNIPTVQVLHAHDAICAKATMYKHGRNCAGQCRSCAALRLPHRALSQHLTAVVGVSRYILEAHRRLGYFAGVPIQRVIHNARAAGTLGCNGIGTLAPHLGVRFGFIGTLASHKGVATLIDAFLQASIPASELWIAGRGHSNYEHSLREQANEDTRIRFLGRVTPAEFYPHVDVVVVPSVCNDNLPGTVFEALAFGKPVLGSRRGGIPEMIRTGENGLLFEPDQPRELSTAMRRLATDVALRQRMARASLESARPFLDLGRFTSSYEDVYRAAILQMNRLQGTIPLDGRSREMDNSAPLTGTRCADPGETRHK